MTQARVPLNGSLEGRPRLCLTLIDASGTTAWSNPIYPDWGA
jgi:hypothetical protein